MNANETSDSSRRPGGRDPDFDAAMRRAEEAGMPKPPEIDRRPELRTPSGSTFINPRYGLPIEG